MIINKRLSVMARKCVTCQKGARDLFAVLFPSISIGSSCCKINIFFPRFRLSGIHLCSCIIRVSHTRKHWLVSIVPHSMSITPSASAHNVNVNVPYSAERSCHQCQRITIDRHGHSHNVYVQLCNASNQLVFTLVDLNKIKWWCPLDGFRFPIKCTHKA